MPKQPQPNLPPKKEENELTINQKDIEKKTRKPLDKTRAAVFHDKRTKRNRTRSDQNRNEINNKDY